MDSFTKLAHAPQLLDQVLVHVHTTQLHPLFTNVEAVQILKSLTSFLVTFQSGDSLRILCRIAHWQYVEGNTAQHKFRTK